MQVVKSGYGNVVLPTLSYLQTLSQEVGNITRSSTNTDVANGQKSKSPLRVNVLLKRDGTRDEKQVSMTETVVVVNVCFSRK